MVKALCTTTGSALRNYTNAKYHRKNNCRIRRLSPPPPITSAYMNQCRRSKIIMTAAYVSAFCCISFSKIHHHWQANSYCYFSRYIPMRQLEQTTRRRRTSAAMYHIENLQQQQERQQLRQQRQQPNNRLSFTTKTIHSNFKMWLNLPVVIDIENNNDAAISFNNNTTTLMNTTQKSNEQQQQQQSVGDDCKDDDDDDDDDTIRQKQSQLQNNALPTPNDFPSWSYDDRTFFRYEILHESTKSDARVGRIYTPHGYIDTPAFVAVATNAALKGIDFQQFNNNHHNYNSRSRILEQPLPSTTSSSSSSSSSSSLPDDDSTATPSVSCNQASELIFCNTYHLMIQPGANIIGEAGGIHEYTKRRNGPFITDSGGFQVFSLAYGSVAEDLASKGELKRSTNKSSRDNNNKNNHHGQLDGVDAVQITEDGVIFRSYRDGNKLLLTPETTVQAQKLIGADIIIPLDELPGYYVNRDRLVESVARTHRWEARSLQEHLKDVKEQAMYCVIHGGMDYELRKESVDYLTSLPFDGYGIGGSLGNGRTELKELLAWLMPLFNKNSDPRIVSKPRHLLGIADEESIRNAIPYGIDTFDSCYPTRLGRHGTALARNGTVKLQSGIHARSFNVKIDDACTCTTCQTYDRAYLCHLFKANEPIATTLVATHNLHYMYDLMAQLRQDIMENKI